MKQICKLVTGNYYKHRAVKRYVHEPTVGWQAWLDQCISG